MLMFPLEARQHPGQDQPDTSVTGEELICQLRQSRQGSGIETRKKDVIFQNTKNILNSTLDICGLNYIKLCEL